MDIEYPEAWTADEYEGEVTAMRMVPPSLVFHRPETRARLILRPIIPSVPAEESPVTAAVLEEDYGLTLPRHYGAYVQTQLYAAKNAAGDLGHLPSRDEAETLPALYSDAPIDDDRFADLDWRLDVEYPRSADREDWTRPAHRPTISVGFRTTARAGAVETLEAMLAVDAIDFSLLPADVTRSEAGFDD